MRRVIWLQTPRVFRLGGGNIFLTYLMYVGLMTEIRTAEPLVSEPSAFEVEMTTEKLTRRKSPGIDQIPAEQSRGLDNSL